MIDTYQKDKKTNNLNRHQKNLQKQKPIFRCTEFYYIIIVESFSFYNPLQLYILYMYKIKIDSIFSIRNVVISGPQ